MTIGAGTAEIGTVKPAKNQSGNAQFLAVDDGSGKLFTSTLLTAGTAQIGSVTASISGTVPVSISSVTIGNSITIGSLPAITGTVTANTGLTQPLTDTQLRAGAISVIVSQPSSLSRVGVNLVDASGTGNYGTSGTALKVSGTVTLGAGTAQIGSVTIGNSITIGSLPAISGTVTVGNTVNFLSGSDSDTNLVENIATALVSNTILGITNALPAGTNQIGSVTASGTVTANAGDTSFFVSGLDVYAHRSVLYSSSGNGFNNDDGAPVDIDNPLPIVGRALQGTSVTTSNFTSTTASTVLANYNATREVLTIFNEGAGNLHICAGATCTTIAYQVRLSSGDYYEVPNHQTTITHSAVFATAGTARVTQVS